MVIEVNTTIAFVAYIIKTSGFAIIVLVGTMIRIIFLILKLELSYHCYDYHDVYFGENITGKLKSK